MLLKKPESKFSESLHEITQAHRSYMDKPDVDLVERAFHFAQFVHRDQQRETGEPYFIHLIETALLAAGLKLDSSSIAAALLHDSIEDCNVTREDLVEEFNSDVASIVDGVTKLTKIGNQSRSHRQADNLKKMLGAADQDIRVILIKLCDRLHNMRTLDVTSSEKQLRKARETQDFYVPLAHRLGLDALEKELEDLCFTYLEPESSRQIGTWLAERKQRDEPFISKVTRLLVALLKTNGVEGIVEPWYKTRHAIWKETTASGITFKEALDVVNFRVIINSDIDCYEILGEIHSLFRPIPNYFHDYIARPRSNLYQSLHTTVINDFVERIPIQIRTTQMHDIATKGIVEYWRLKENTQEMTHEFNLGWIDECLGINQQTDNHQEYLDSVKTELLPFEIITLTPKGDPVVLPENATPLDFAYALSHKIGHKTVSAVVNGQEKPINSRLKDGDTVELITSEDQNPVPEWLHYVQLPKARQQIKVYLESRTKRKSYTLGREMIAKVLSEKNQRIEDLETLGHIREMTRRVGLSSVSSLFQRVASGIIDPEELLEYLEVEGEGFVTPMSETDLSSEPLVDKEGNQSPFVTTDCPNCLFRAAKCCDPIPDQTVEGIISESGRIDVHLSSCKTIENTPHQLRKQVRWNPDFQHDWHTRLQVDTKDEIGIFKKVVEKITAANVSVVHAEISTTKQKKGIFDFELLVKSYQQYQALISTVEKVPGVINVKRKVSGRKSVRKKSSLS